MKALESRQGVATEYVEFEGCGHVPMDERPEQFNAAVLPFVNRVLAQGNGQHAESQSEADFESVRQPLQAAELTAAEHDAIPV